MNRCIKLLSKEKLSISFIESASAGYLAYRFSQNKYSGDILYGGLVCYDMKVKENILKISPKFIKKYTPESMEVTQEMVRKASKIFNSDLYIGCTGLLKRGGSETKEKPVGTFFYVISYKDNIYSFRCFCKGKPKEKLKKLMKNINQSLIKILEKKK
ncbi:nicotinamide-nucleotide amidohydrolase family protein [Acinetobacter sp. ANC 4216]|uniref:CinA family protein n=1 Tax=Acinetobacter sp. ANC 4216 TaxID=2529840 RepID=UPI00103981B5|nr:nicotinamide-nucleotide amidohydrolase family protein [Acinetobacter sp. ANC 4216]TCB63452.1 nicotinamide-nucleotide amidohydrolase family protein [Acinetobacter sp. ANC 4216]